MTVLRKLFCARFLSPIGFVVRALLLAAIFIFCELLGWREHTTFISGTTASINTEIGTSVILGLIYMFAYFAFVLVSPVLLLAAVILTLWQRFVKFRTRS